MKRIREPKHPGFRDPVQKLIKALNRLKAEQQAAARRRHRSEVRRALRDVKAQMERDFPLINKETGKPRKPRADFATRQRRLMEADFVEFTGLNAVELLKLTAAKVPLRRLAVPGTGRIQIWGRRWAWILRARSEADLALAAKSPSTRKVMLAEEALAKSKENQP